MIVALDFKIHKELKIADKHPLIQLKKTIKRIFTFTLYGT